MTYRPISDYGIVGDMHSAALVSCDGSVDWLCFPRFDSPSVFAAILDDAKGGYFRIQPAGEFECQQHYRPGTNILETRFRTTSGSGFITELMPIDRDLSECQHKLIRVVVCESGTMAFEIEFRPRLDYARPETEIRVSGVNAFARKGDCFLTLAGKVPLEPADGGAGARFTLHSGQRAEFVLHWDEGNEPKLEGYDVAEQVRQAEEFWLAVSDDWNYRGLWQQLVRRAMLALHLLVYAPSGAMCAAVTTSLPEAIGGVRNWDYRFAWPRDAAFTFDIFHRLGHTSYTRPFLDWLVQQVVSEEPGHELHSLYPIAGNDRHTMEEITLDHLEGYKGSRPVRIGNAAYHQFQLDVFGEFMLALDSYEKAGGELDESLWTIAVWMVEGAARRWKEPDLGIWEFRTEPRHFTYSKLMCWVALDRGLRLANRLQRPVDFDRWRSTREDIRRAVMEGGWNERRRSFTQYLGGESLDASMLFLPMVGFLPGNDPRVYSTITAIWDELGEDGLIRRYVPEKTDDGLPGEEGTFTMCSLWLAGALVAAGRVEEAEALFEKIVSLGNHVGLFSEMLDPRTEEYLGNYPQAFTHIALVHTARNLDRALNRRERDSLGRR